MMDKILIVGAHFDDSELGVGGTAAKLVKDNKIVYKLTLTDNVTKFEKKNIFVDYDSSKQQSCNACGILGVRELTDFEPEPCSGLRYSKVIMQRIERYILDLEIDTLFMHFASDMNTDHVEASKICLTAGRHCRNIIQYQSNGYVLENVYYPTFFVDISNEIDAKKRALMCYGKEHDRFGRLFETCIERDHIWGYANKVEYAEGFNVVKMLY